MRVRDRLGISPTAQRRLTWGMEVVLVGLLFIGLERGRVGIVINTGLALAVSQLPPALTRSWEEPLDPALTLWITAAVFLHALGVVGLPGGDVSFYRSIWWWDHLTHALSASIVAGVGYSAARSFDTHYDSVSLPPTFMFAFILVFVLAFGVAWEVLEFLLSEFTAALGADPILTQYGLDDTILDLVFDTVGAVMVALVGTAHLGDVVDILTDRLAD